MRSLRGWWFSRVATMNRIHHAAETISCRLFTALADHNVYRKWISRCRTRGLAARCSVPSCLRAIRRKLVEHTRHPTFVRMADDPPGAATPFPRLARSRQLEAGQHKFRFGHKTAPDLAPIRHPRAFAARFTPRGLPNRNPGKSFAKKRLSLL
jgi:hypothetical protein